MAQMHARTGGDVYVCETCGKEKPGGSEEGGEQTEDRFYDRMDQAFWDVACEDEYENRLNDDDFNEFVSACNSAGMLNVNALSKQLLVR